MLGKIALLLSLAAFCACGEVIQCNSTVATEQVITTASAVFGCDGSAPRQRNLQWTVKANPGVTRFLWFQNVNCVLGSWHALQIDQGARRKIWVRAGNTCDIPQDRPLVLRDDEDVVVSWLGAGATSAESVKFAIVIDKAVSYTPVKTGLTRLLPAFTLGAGWQYAGFDAYNGTMMGWEVTVKQYRGMTPPLLYLSRKYLPTINSFDLQNTTTCKTGAGFSECSGILVLTKPPEGLWSFGIYSTGPYSSVSVRPHWLYNATGLINGGKITKTDATENLYQVVLDSWTRQLNLKIARLPPGGSTTIQISTGYSPYSQHFDYRLMVNTTSDWDEVAIANPYKAGAPNPGQYLIRVIPSNSAGSVFQVWWL